MLSRFPRVKLAHLPTPLEPLPRLTQHLGGPRIYIKRDDATGLASGGNKVRKLEFLVADALANGCDAIVTEGGVQSNHCRQTAAAAARLGLGCHLVLDRHVPGRQSSYASTGNILLDRLLGAEVHIVDAQAERKQRMAEVADDCRRRGHKPYVIPTGGSNAVGSLGYVHFAFELDSQSAQQGVLVDHVVLATGSGGTQGGLLAGLSYLDGRTSVIGIDIDAEPEAVRAAVTNSWQATTDMVRAQLLDPARIVVETGYAGEAYGVPTGAGREAIALLARLEGLILDPVYTGKAMAGLIDLVKRGRFRADETVVFVHTGGFPGVFAYSEFLAPAAR
jgi:D-cysteine desulfhydrase family pyridoxal phosphate-dependent enzyme